MAVSTRYSTARTPSPTRSTSYSGTSHGQQQLPNVVKKLAIVGKAERGPDGKGDGASIKMYLKIALPLNISPGSTIPLFKEENLKILDCQVHPLDNNSVPYNFSTTACPILRKAGRALNLPARSRDSYMSLFRSTASSSSAVPPSAAPLDDRYTGRIQVTEYHVSYVLPKEFPPRNSSAVGSTGRRTTSPELHFMAAIDMWAPFVTRPPSSPYLLSLPVPKCLSNHIRLRIFSPHTGNISSSMASLSSVEGEPSTWDLTSDPHVTRSPSKRLSRSSSYQNFADEDTSDSSTTGFSDGYGIQGSFPSTDRVRVRWAAPMKPSEVPETSDGRRRVGIREVKGDMTCMVLERIQTNGKDRGSDDEEQEGIVMKVEYTAICKGVWFPGVATMLGMDVSLDAKDCEVNWAPGEEHKWTVSGGPGFTGFAVGPPPRAMKTEASANSVHSTPHALPQDSRANGHKPNVSASSISLLRAPLPAQVTDDSSYDESPGATPLSSVASLATIPSSPERRRSRASSVGPRTDPEVDSSDVVRHPKVPISIHLNMNELVPPQKGTFTFTIAGTIMVIPQNNPFLLSRASSDASDISNSDPFPLPQFRVFYAEKETLSSVIRNEMDDSALDIFNATGRLSDPQSRKTVLQPGGQTKCGVDGARISLRSMSSPNSFSHRSRRDASVDSIRRPPSRPRTPSNAMPRQPSSAGLRQTFLLGTPKPKRDGPLMIPRVDVKITPLVPRGSGIPTEYAVRISLPAPSDADSEWLEFGLAQPSEPLETTKNASAKSPRANGDASAADRLPPQVQVASASYEGVPVKFETSATVKPDGKLPALGLTFEETSTKEWMTWVKVHVGETGGGTMEVVYLVKPESTDPGSIKRSKKGTSLLSVLLPTFSLPVGVMEVLIDTQSEFELASLQHNFSHQQTSSKGRTLTHYSLEEYFYPSLTITITSATRPKTSKTLYLWSALAVILGCMTATMAHKIVSTNQAMQVELTQAQEALQSCSMQLVDASLVVPETVTLTTTSTIHTTSYATLTVSQPIPQQTAVSLSSTESVETVLAPAEPAQPTQSPVPTVMSTLTPTVTEQHAATAIHSPEDSALLPIRDLPFLFPIRFDISSLDIPDAARNTAQVVARGLGIAWQFCRKVYHYPLDPP